MPAYVFVRLGYCFVRLPVVPVPRLITNLEHTAANTATVVAVQSTKDDLNAIISGEGAVHRKQPGALSSIHLPHFAH